MDGTSARIAGAREFLTVADLVAMAHLGLDLVAGHQGSGNAVVWTHTSELADPGPWLEGGELLIVNGFGIPHSASEQVAYVEGLARHRLAGVAISALAPPLTAEMLAAADRLGFPVLRIPRQVPFIELSYLVANASDRSARSRLARHLEIFKTLRLRNSREGDVAAIYAQLEKVSGYRLALLTPAGRPLLAQWPRMPHDLVLDLHARPSTDLQIIEGGFVIPLVVGQRVTAYLVGQEHPEAAPGGLAALQHVSTLAVLDAIDDQRRREAMHREGGEVLRMALDERTAPEVSRDRLVPFGLGDLAGTRMVAFGQTNASVSAELAVRDWLADRGVPHVLTSQEQPLALVHCHDEQLSTMSADLKLDIGVSSAAADIGDLGRMRRQANWCLGLAIAAPGHTTMFAEQQRGLSQWLISDLDIVGHLAAEVLRPLAEYDARSGTNLVRTLAVYLRNNGRLRPAAKQLFVHEHTLTYRLRRVEELTGRSLKNYRDTFELWLAVEAAHSLEEP